MFAFENQLHRAQIVGQIGRELMALTGGKISVPRIFALDPARKLFELKDSRTVLQLFLSS